MRGVNERKSFIGRVGRVERSLPTPLPSLLVRFHAWTSTMSTVLAAYDYIFDFETNGHFRRVTMTLRPELP